MRVITSSSVSLGEVLTNILVPRNATLLKLFLIDVWKYSVCSLRISPFIKGISYLRERKSSCPEERQCPFKMDFGYDVNQFVVYIKGG